MDKKTKIMQAAIRVISAYGYKRSTMDDIAREAGISRPAVYQIFKNKDDVFRSCVDYTIQQSFDLAHAEMEKHSDVLARLTAYITTYLVYFHRLLITGPHSAEILEVKSRLIGTDETDWPQQFAISLNKIMQRKDHAEDGIILAQATIGIKTATQDEAVLINRLEIMIERFYRPNPD